MDFLTNIDRTLFFWVNGWPHFPASDALALFLSGVGSFGLIWIFIGSVLIYLEEEKDHWFFIPLLCGTAVTYFLTELLMKPFFGRVRPQFLDGSSLVLSEPLSTHSFPSGHSMVAFALAVILSRKEPRLKVVFYVLAGLIALSRVYLGVHYPGDILGGGLIGLVIGQVINTLTLLLRPSSKRKRIKSRI